MSNAASPAPKPNGTAGVLSTLAASGNQWVQLATVGLVALSGFGNWAATTSSSNRNREEITQGQERIRAEVIRQVDEIHEWVEKSRAEFHQGNEDSAANRKLLTAIMREDLQAFEERQQTALVNQQKIMQAQTQILENDTVLIRNINKIVEQFAAWKKLEQERGAP
jgi:hypothetical protein